MYLLTENSPIMNTARPTRILLILAFLAVYIIWGTTYLANRFGLLGMKPFILSSLRYMTVAIVLLGWAGVKRLKFPSWKNARVLAISGLLMLVGGSGLVVTGELYINSGATAVIIATEPLLFLLFDRQNRKSYSALTLVGFILGFAGIFLFSRFTGGSDALSAGHPGDVLKGTIIVLISTVFWVLGTLYARKNSSNSSSPISNVAIQHLAGGLACVLIAAVKGDWASFHPSQITLPAWSGLAYLIIMGSLVAFMAFMWLVRVMPPAIVSTHTYVNPIVAVIAGWIMAGESIGVMQFVALGMVLAGVLLVQSKKRVTLFNKQPDQKRSPKFRQPHQKRSPEIRQPRQPQCEPGA